MQHTTIRANAPIAQQPEWLRSMVETIATAVAHEVRKKLIAVQEPPQPAAQHSPWVTVEEAAVFLRCKPQRVYDLLSSGQLRRHKEGGRVLILRSDLDLRVEAANRVLTGARRANGHA